MSHAKDTPKSAVWIQHRVKPEVKAWIAREAQAQERSQGWIANRILEDAYARAGKAAAHPEGAM